MGNHNRHRTTHVSNLVLPPADTTEWQFLRLYQVPRGHTSPIGRDVVDSWLDMHQRNSWYSEYAKPFSSQEERLEALKFYAPLWKTRILTTKRAYEKHDPTLRLLIRYEDLRVNTIKELRRIFQSMELKLQRTTWMTLCKGIALRRYLNQRRDPDASPEWHHRELGERILRLMSRRF